MEIYSYLWNFWIWLGKCVFRPLHRKKLQNPARGGRPGTAPRPPQPWTGLWCGTPGGRGPMCRAAPRRGKKASSPCGSGAFPENLTNPLPRQRTAAYCQKDVAFRSHPDQFGSSFFQIHLQSIQSGSPYGHQPGFIPLPQHADKSFIFIKTL